MQNTVAKAVEISVAVSISFENFNFVVAAFNETVCKWSSERIKYSCRHPIKFCVNNNPSSNNKTADCGVIRLSDLPRVNFSFLSAECYARSA